MSEEEGRLTRGIGAGRGQGRVAGLFEEASQASQLLGSSQSPWMNTTGARRRRSPLDLRILAVGDR